MNNCSYAKHVATRIVTNNYQRTFTYQLSSYPSWSWIDFAQSVEQDQRAHTCSLILLCTLRYAIIYFCQRTPPPPPIKNNFINLNLYNCQKFKLGAKSVNKSIPKEERKAFENIVGKGENAGNQHFLLFPQCFLLYQKTEIIISVTVNLSSAYSFNLDKPKIFSFGKELVQYEIWSGWKEKPKYIEQSSSLQVCCFLLSFIAKCTRKRL